jgi:hypothetical protein
MLLLTTGLLKARNMSSRVSCKSRAHTCTLNQAPIPFPELTIRLPKMQSLNVRRGATKDEDRNIIFDPSSTSEEDAKS